MPSHTIRRAVIAALLAVLVPVAASAQDSSSSVPAGLIVPRNAPALVTSCRFGQNTILGLGATLVIGNRTKHTMTGADVAFTAYDTEGTKFSQEVKHLNLDSGVLSADTVVQNSSFDIDLRPVGGHLNLVGKIGCEIVAATFTGERRWQVGETWPEAIVPLQSAQMTMETGAGGAGPAARSAVSRYSVSVVNSWNDDQAGVLIVHDTVAITAGDADVTLHPQDLILSMTLAGGQKKSYYGLAHSAPQYEKVIPGVGSSMVPEVAPASDLGAIGALTIPAHSSATTTVTFLIGDVVATPTDNRAVSVR